MSLIVMPNNKEARKMLLDHYRSELKIGAVLAVIAFGIGGTYWYFFM